MKLRNILSVFFLITLFSMPSLAQDIWDFKLTHASKKLIDSPFFLMTSADLNKNGIKELIVADFGQFGAHIEEWKQWKETPTSFYNLFVLEWAENELKLKWKKQWDMTKTKTDLEAHKYFMAFEAKQMVTWEIGDKVVVETIPPYLGIEWIKDKYVLHEQQGPHTKGTMVGSWALPWLNASCYQFFTPADIWPHECLVGIRDFGGKGNPKIVTIVEDKIGDKKYKQILRVRKFEPGFPIKWEKESPERFVLMEPVDRLNNKSYSGLLMRVFRTAKWYIFELAEKGLDYRLRELKFEGARGIELYDMPDIYLKTTQKKEIEEFWGYHLVDIPNPNYHDFILLLRKVTLKPDLTGFVKEDIDFPHHKSFLGVGFFDLKDIDGDGLDEVILVEETGKKEFGGETVYYSDIKDYIRILKWDGKEYKTMWVSPPYTKRGTKFLVEDIKNTGKKQLVVMTSNGTIQIWEKQ